MLSAPEPSPGLLPAAAAAAALLVFACVQALSLYRAWGIWGDRSAGRAYLSVQSPPLTNQSTDSPAEPQLSCCERNQNAEGCVACTGYPSTDYHPLDFAEAEPAGEPAKEAVVETPEEKKAEKQWSPQEAFQPVSQTELFTLLPSLGEQLGTTDVCCSHCF